MVDDNENSRKPSLELDITAPPATVGTDTPTDSTTAGSSGNDGFTMEEETGDNLYGDVDDDDWTVLKKNGGSVASTPDGTTDGTGNGETDAATPEVEGFKALLDSLSEASTTPVMSFASGDGPEVEPAKDGGRPAAGADEAAAAPEVTENLRPGEISPPEPPKLDNLQSFLIERAVGLPPHLVQARLIDGTRRGLEEFFNSLDPESKKKYQQILESPERMDKLAAAKLKEQALRLVDDHVKEGKLTDLDATKLKEALGKGEFPSPVLKLMLEQERSKGQFGVATKAAYSSVLDTAQTDTGANVASALLNGRALPASEALPFKIGENGTPLLDGTTRDTALRGKIDYHKLASDTVPTDSQLKKLEGLLEFNKSLSGQGQPNHLERFQTLLEQKVEKLDMQRLYTAIKNESRQNLKAQFREGKLPEDLMEQLKAAQTRGTFEAEINALSDKTLGQLVEASLTRQVKDGKLSAADKTKLLDLETNGIISKSTAVDLLKQEGNLNTEGVITRATAHCLEGYYNRRFTNANQRIERDKAETPEGSPLTPGERLAIGPPAGEPIGKDTMTAAPEKIEKLEAWLEQVEGKRNPQLDRLHGMLTGLGPTVEPAKVAEQMRKNLVPQVEEQYRKKQLPEATLKELSDLEAGDDKAAFKEKLLELAGEELRKTLKQELDDNVRAGLVPQNGADKLIESIDKGEAPELLLLSMLEKESGDHQFGLVTKSFYTALVDKLNTQVPSNFIALAKSGLPLPPDCPIQVPLSEEGRPLLKNNLAAEVAAAFADGKAPPKILGMDPGEIPTEDSLNQLFRAAKWNSDASTALFENFQEFNAKMLDETVVKLGRQDWRRQEGDNREEWMARVGPMVDLTMKVKATAQSLKLGEKMSKSNQTSISRTALTRDFPGEVKFDKDGNITDIKLNLPSDLTPSYENSLQLARIQEWLDKNEGPAKQVMEQLAEAAANDSRILIWQDMPNKGKISVDGKMEAFNLEKHRVRVENITGPDGKPKVRIYNHVDYHQSEIYNLWDLGARKVGTRECLSLSSEEEMKQIFADAKVPADKIPGLIKALKDSEDLANSNKKADSIGDNKADVDRITDVLKQAGVVNPEELSAKIYKNYRDYEPGDMVALYKDGQVQMIMAKNVESWRASEERMQNIGKGLTIAMDVGMCVVGGVHVAAAVKGAQLAAKAGSVVLRQAIASAIKQNIKQAVKSFALGGSGFFVNNAEVLSTDWGKTAHHARNIVFVLDGVHSLGAFSRGMAGKAGLLKGPALTKDAMALNRANRLLEKFAYPNVIKHPLGALTWTNAGVLFGAEMTLGYQLSTDLAKKFSGNHTQEPGLKYGKQLLNRMQGDEDNATRFLRTTSDALAGGDNALKTKFEDLTAELSAGQKLDGEDRAKKAQELLSRYDKCKDQNEKTMLAIGILMMSQKPDGSFEENVGTRPRWTGDTRGQDVTSKDILKTINETFAKGTPEQKLMLGQTLVGFGKMDMPQYATMCRELVNDDNAPKDVKMQAVLGLAACIDAAAMQKAHGGANQGASIFNNFGCSPAALETTLNEIANTAKDPDVQAMATAISNAYRYEDRQEIQSRIARVAGEWQAIKLNSEIQEMETKLKALGADDPAKEGLEKDLAARKDQLDGTLKILAILNNPNLLLEMAKSQQAADTERDAQALRALTSRADLAQMQSRLEKLPADSPERPALEAQIKQATEKAKQLEEKLAELEKASDNPAFDPKNLPPVPSSLSKSVADSLLKDLRSPTPDDDALLAAWAARKIVTIDGINMLKSDKGDLKHNELEATLVGLVKLEHGPAAVEALTRLLPDKIKALTPDQKAALKGEVKLLMGRPHGLDPGETGPSAERKHEAAEAKIKLLGVTQQLLDSGIFGLPEKTEMVNEVINLLDRKPGNPGFAGQHAELRLAAVRSLGALKDVIRDLPADRKQAIFDVLHASMRPPTTITPGPNQQPVKEGESNPTVRRTAFETAKLLGDPDLLKHALECMAGEQDPDLATEYGCLEFETLRPDRPDCALRIFDYEVNYWTQVLNYSKSRINNDEAGKHLEKHFRHIHPRTGASIEAMSEQKLHAEDVTNIFGQFNSDKWNAAIKKYRHPVTEAKRNEWNKLIADAGRTGPEGDLGKAGLLYMATLNSWHRQLDAAQEIRRLVNADVPDKELFYPGIIEAFHHDNTQCKHEVRMEFIGMLNDLLTSNPPKISTQYAGRIAYEALKIEMSPTRLGRTSFTDHEAIQRQTALLDLLDKCNYPLALPEIKALATAKRIDTGAEFSIAPTVREAALKLYQKLQDTAPRTPGDQKACTELLAKTVTLRQNTLKKLDERVTTVSAEQKAFLASGKADSADSLKRRAAICAAASDGGDTIDSLATKKAINDACMHNPIRRPDDTRIPHLQALLADRDSSVALIAAWHLIKAADPVNTKDERAREILQSQPWFAKAKQKLEEIKNSNPQTDAERQTQKNAERYLLILQKWNLKEIEANPFETKKDLSPQERQVKDALAELDPGNFLSTPEQKREALDTLIRVSAHQYHEGNPALHKLAENTARQIAGGKDAVLAQAAYEAIVRSNNEFKPVSETIESGGRRVLSWNNNTKTTITEGLDSRRIDYPDGSWMQFNLGERGQVTSYESSEHKGVVRKAGTDFAPGAVSVTADGIATFDTADGVRQVRLAGGDSWSYYRGATDAKKCAAAFNEALEAAGSVPDKIAAVSNTIYGFGPESSPITGADDPRILTLIDLLKPEGERTEEATALSYAAARALLEPRNQGLDEIAIEEARKVFLEEELEGTFLKDAPASEILSQMADSMRLLGKITVVDDPRRAMFVDALKSTDSNVRLEAARIVADGNNGAFSADDRVAAMKTVIDVTSKDEKYKSDPTLIRDAFKIIESAGKSLGDYEGKLDDLRSVKFQGGVLVKATFRDGAFECGWDSKGLNRIQTGYDGNTFNGDTISDYVDSDAKANCHISWLRATSAKDALDMAIASGDQRVSMAAATALTHTDSVFHRQRGLDILIAKATRSENGTTQKASAEKLSSVIKRWPLDDQLYARIRWQNEHAVSGRGFTPEPLPEDTLKKFTFPDATMAEWDKVKILYNGVGWVHDGAPAQLKGDNHADAIEILRLANQRSLNNSRDVCEAIFSSLKNNPISDINDPRRDVLARLSEGTDRVALAAAWMLSKSKVPQDFETGTEKLAKLATSRTSLSVTKDESKSLLKDVITYGGDHQVKFALETWDKQWNTNKPPVAEDKPPSPTATDRMRRYMFHADKAASDRFYQLPADVRKAIALTMHNLDNPKAQISEAQLEAYIQPQASFTSMDPFATPRDRFRDPFADRLSNPFRLGMYDRPRTKVEQLLDFTGGAVDVPDWDGIGRRDFRTARISPEAWRLPEGKEKPYLADQLQREFNRYGTGAQVEVGDDGLIALKLDGGRFGRKDDKPLVITGTEKDEALAFYESASPQLMAQFSRELLAARPDIARQTTIDAGDLAIMFKNWVTQKGAGNQNVFFSNNYHDSVVTDLAMAPPKMWWRENRGSYYDRPNDTVKPDMWVELSKQRDQQRDVNLNAKLKSSLEIKAPVDGRPHWRPADKPTIATPDLVSTPPLDILDRYKSNVVTLLPESLRESAPYGQVSIALLRRMAADSNPDRDLIVIPGLGTGKEFKMDDASLRMLGIIRAQKTREGMRIINLTPPGP